MTRADRRKFRRTRLRLRIARLKGLDLSAVAGSLWTTDVSAGGMFFHAPLAAEPKVGARVSFELDVPPGEGYSASEGKIRGSGKVVRAVPVAESNVGLGVQFTRPLALQF
jgi:hypothetical protein